MNFPRPVLLLMGALVLRAPGPTPTTCFVPSLIIFPIRISSSYLALFPSTSHFPFPPTPHYLPTSHFSYHPTLHAPAPLLPAVNLHYILSTFPVLSFSRCLRSASYLVLARSASYDPCYLSTLYTTSCGYRVRTYETPGLLQ